MTYTNPQYLVSTDELAQAYASHADRLRVFDVTVNLVPNPPGYKAVSGREEFEKAHLPGAMFLDLISDLSDTTSGLGFTLPSTDHLQQAYQQAGISEDSDVVFYSTGHMMWATRAWWMLHACGHKNVRVLDGGYEKWIGEQRAVSSATNVAAPGNFLAEINAERWADQASTLAAVDDASTCTINALSPGVYSGDADMHYGRKGHIENSQNVFYDEVLENGCFRSAEELETLFSGRDILEAPSVIVYCGGGISATIDAFALLLLGHSQVAVYDGSMSEWVRDENLPLVTGTG